MVLLPIAFVVVLVLVAGSGSASSGGSRSDAAALAAPTNTSQPGVVGDAAMSSRVAAARGTWSNSPTSFSYQWRRCDSGGGSCIDIGGATEETYGLVADDAGKKVRVRVTATNSDGSNSATSDATDTVAGTAPGVPASTSAPILSGPAQQGQTITTSTGGWSSSSGLTFAFQWLRCDEAGKSCSDIGGATSQSYAVSSSDIGKTIRVRVKATNSTGSSTAVAGATGIVTGGAPANTAAPTISGTPRQGQTLTGNRGAWTNAPVDFNYQWLRCNTGGGACRNVEGAKSQTYTLKSEDVGHTVRVLVTATNSAGRASAESAQTPVISAAGPANTALPAIAGAPVVGQRLTASPGSWTGSTPVTVSYQWFRCDANGQNCGAIVGARSQTYVVTLADVGRRLLVQVRAANSAGATFASSAKTAVVGAGSATSVPIAAVALPNRLVVDRIQFIPSRIRSRQEPLAARFHVSEISGRRSVAGALVYAVGVPFNRLSNQPEAQTGADGWATITFRILATFELRRGNFVVVFVRARKPGESVLAGVSTRRLVSVRVG